MNQGSTLTMRGRERHTRMPLALQQARRPILASAALDDGTLITAPVRQYPDEQ